MARMSANVRPQHERFLLTELRDAFPDLTREECSTIAHNLEYIVLRAAYLQRYPQDLNTVELGDIVKWANQILDLVH